MAWVDVHFHSIPSWSPTPLLAVQWLCVGYEQEEETETKAEIPRCQLLAPRRPCAARKAACPAAQCTTQQHVFFMARRSCARDALGNVARFRIPTRHLFGMF